jgi:hypothetical protein
MTKILSVGILVIFLLLIIELCRAGKLTFKYALGWLVFAVVGIVGALFDRSVSALAHGLGFMVTSNFIFFSLMVFFIILSLFLTTFLCQQNKRNDIMAQKIAILDLELKELKENLKDPHG